MSHLPPGTLEHITRRTSQDILIPDVVQSPTGWRAFVRTARDTLVWVDSDCRACEAAWDRAIQAIIIIANERKCQSASDAIHAYIGAVLDLENRDLDTHNPEGRPVEVLIDRVENAYCRMLARLDRLADADIERVLAANPMKDLDGTAFPVTTLAQVRNSDLVALRQVLRASARRLR